jgi:uncharacterized damage-inducible protein DinB
MSPHPLVVQLRFARSELVRCLEDVTPEDAFRRVQPMNCISWVIGHLANQENAYWNILPGRENRAPRLNDLVGFGKPASTPPLDEMWTAWREVTRAADSYLDTLDGAQMQEFFVWKGEKRPESIGTMLLRNIYHYWFHTGEAHAMRQLLGNMDLPQFVGDMSLAKYDF